MKVVAFVPIKFESQRLQNKNILPLGKHPLCWYIFKSLQQVKYIDKIYVYCSDSKIKQYIPQDIEFLQRDPILDSNTTLGINIYQHFRQQVNADIYLLAHATSPFVSCQSLQIGLDKVISNQYDSAYSVQKLKTYCWYQNKPLNYQLNNIVRTQNLNEIYAETSAFYIFHHSVLDDFKQRIGNKSYPVVTSQIEAIDIDEIGDYQLAKSIANYLPQFNTINYPSHIETILLDFDGTMSDGHIYLNETGDISKHYNVKDGYILKKLSKLFPDTLEIYLISGNDLTFFQKKADSFNIKLIGKCSNKLKYITQNLPHINLQKTFFMGDDDNDLELLKNVRFSASPSNASHNIRQNVDYISDCRGGEGAVRQVLELLLNHNCFLSPVIVESGK